MVRVFGAAHHRKRPAGVGGGGEHIDAAANRTGPHQSTSIAGLGLSAGLAATTGTTAGDGQGAVVPLEKELALERYCDAGQAAAQASHSPRAWAAGTSRRDSTDAAQM